MTKLDSILKSRDITFPTKVCLVKAMVFPVVMYGYESWTVGGRSQDGGGIGWGDHFLFYKFIERTTER